VNDEFFLELKKNPAYAHIDMERENGKMDAWLALPANRNRIKTRKFVLNWLNKIESPLNVAVPQETALEKFLRRGS
jgi:ABC-type transport system involved in cytochrome c biogenesis permease component